MYSLLWGGGFSWKYRGEEFIYIEYKDCIVCWGGDLAGNIEGRNLSKKVFLFARIWGCIVCWGGGGFTWDIEGRNLLKCYFFL